jgi:hypothetical protein
MEILDIYRHEPDGSFSWVTSADSMKMARMIIRSRAANTSEEFLIHDDQADETIMLRSDGHWSYQKAEQTRVPSSDSSGLPAKID